MRVLLLVAILAEAPATWAQNPRAVMEESLAKQRESVAKQKSAIRAQMEKDGTAQPEDTFFTVPWSLPATILPATAQCDPLPSQKIDPLVAEISGREGLAPDLVHAVIGKESGYRPCAVSRKGAGGLMQLMPETAADFGVYNVFDPRENVQAGAKFLKQLLARYDGSVPLALAAYNAGPARVDAAGGVPFIPETLDYVSAIVSELRPQANTNLLFSPRRGGILLSNVD